jgi:hypothetical protein
MSVIEGLNSGQSAARKQLTQGAARSAPIKTQHTGADPTNAVAG